jgi:uncharacterized damage-inducible protein DinB
MTATTLAMAATTFAQGRGGAPACTTLACDVQADFDRTRATITGIAVAMPDDKFGFKPTPAQRTFGEQVMHIATTDAMLWGTLGGKTPAPTLNAKATSKAEVMAELAKAYDYQAAVLKELATDAQLTERVKSLPFMGPTVSRLRLINFSFGHSQDIYGQMAVYLRLNGVIPPASNRGGV